MIQEQLRNATFRGINFLVKSSMINFSQKTVVHEYPNSNRIEVQFLGENPESFSLEIIINSEGDQYFRDRSALKAALLDPSIGKLVHPYEGQINCAVVGRPQLREGDRENGVARFSVDFIRVDEKIFPTETTDNSGQIESLRDSVEFSINTFIDEIFDIVYSESYSDAKDLLNKTVDVYSDLTDSINITADKITSVKTTISSFSNNILKYLSGDESLADALIDLPNSLTDIGSTPSDQVDLWLDTFDQIPDNPVFQISTAPRTETLTNSDVINTSQKAMILSNLYNYTTQIQFTSVDDIDEYREKLETRYQELVQPDISIPSSYLSITSLQDSDIAYNLSKLRAQTQKYLDGLENTVGEVVTIDNVQQTNLTDFVYKYYGNLDNYNQVLELNDFQDPTQISGSIQIII